MDPENLKSLVNVIRNSENATTDAIAAEVVFYDALERRYVWCAGIGWLKYDQGAWATTSEESVKETVRRQIKHWLAIETATASSQRLQDLVSLLNARRIGAITNLCRGIAEIKVHDLDQHPDLLNVANGVVDLRTGEFRQHDPNLFFTKITNANYKPGATHKDWDETLRALPDEVADWMQVRVGQAFTGHMTQDDMLPVLTGVGANAKSTWFGTIEKVGGSFAVKVPEKVLMAGNNEHSTEMTTLRGARFAYIEETPDARHLNVKRLKDVLGQATITARRIRQDNMTWNATHSLFLTTNYVPRVEETDHGTWRRLALVRFPYRFVNTPVTEMDRRKDPRLRDDLLRGHGGRHEAVLAWIVEGARRWYDNDRRIPPKPVQVEEDTITWRGEVDLILGFIDERVEFAAGGVLASKDLFQQFTDYLEVRNHPTWTEATFSQRWHHHPFVEQHRVKKGRSQELSAITRPSHVNAKDLVDLRGQEIVWRGVGWKSNIDMSAFEERI